MASRDLDGVATLHRQCFAGSGSFLSVLGHDIVKRSYEYAMADADTVVVVLEDPSSGGVIGWAAATSRLGFTRRFVLSHPVRFGLSLLKGLLTDPEVRSETWEKVRRTRRVTEGAESELPGAGRPSADGPEAFFLVIGVHEEWRGGGNAPRLIEYLSERMWERDFARLRGFVSTSNLASLILYKNLGWSMQRGPGDQVFVWTDRPTH
ncbi:MAG: GNAT family N-acetyltransferase [Gemmatimonadota bacterium]|nr:GNAT family N-acetyltransferase [Gemmatimonadota bacterium]